MKMSTYTIPLKIDENEYLLINARTGAFDLVDKDVIKLLQGTQRDSSVEEFLKERGHLTELSPAEELDCITDMYHEFLRVHHQFYYHMIIPTYQCNLTCTYCFLSDLQHKGKKWLTTVIDDCHLTTVFDVITALDKGKKRRIALYGGEPLLVKNKPVIEKILKKGKENGYKFTILTNGVSVVDFLDILVKYPVSILQITIDGPKEIHDTRRIKRDGTGTFDDIVRGVDAAVKAGLTVLLRTNLDKVNVESLPRIMAFFKEKGWSDNPKVHMRFAPVFEKGCGNYDLIMPRKSVYQSVISHAVQNPAVQRMSFDDMRGVELFEKVFVTGELGAPRFWYCESNAGRLIYDPFGDIYICPEHVGTETIKVGTYYPSLVWNETYQMWRERTILTIPECRKCRYALFCGGGCSYEALQRFGTLSKPVCYDYREIFTMVIPHLYKMLRKL